MLVNTRTFVIIGLTCFAGQAHANTTFMDGVFAPATWASSTVTNTGGSGSTSVETQFLTGGNPNEFMRIDLTLHVNGPDSAVWSLNTNNTAFYNPVSQGAITSINYSEDSRNFAPNNAGNVQGTGLLIVQGGKVFTQRNPVLVMPSPGFSNWAPNSAPGLVAADLWELTNTGTLIFNSNPDFSATGGTMQFGFWRGASSGTTGSGTYFRDAGIDNWRVEIVPSPGAFAVFAVGGLVAVRRRR